MTMPSCTSRASTPAFLKSSIRARLAPGTVRAGGAGMVTSTRGGSAWGCFAQPAVPAASARSGLAASRMAQISLRIRRTFYRKGGEPDCGGAIPIVTASLFHVEVERGGIDAVAQAVVAGAILEHVSEMGA